MDACSAHGMGDHIAQRETVGGPQRRRRARRVVREQCVGRGRRPGERPVGFRRHVSVPEVGGTCTVEVFVLDVELLEDTWPELRASDATG